MYFSPSILEKIFGNIPFILLEAQYSKYKASLICSFQNFRFRWKFTNFLGAPEKKCLAEEFFSVFIIYNEVYGLKEDRMTLV